MAEQLSTTAEVKPAEKPATNVAVATEALSQLAAPPKRRKINDEPPPPAPETVPEAAFADVETPEPAATPAAPVEKPAASPAAEFPADLINFGAQLGIDAEEVKSYGSPEAAHKMLNRIVRAYEVGQQQARPKEPEKAAEKPAEKPLEFDPTIFDSEAYAHVPEVRVAMKALHETREQNRLLQEKFDKIEGVVQQIAHAEHTRAVSHVHRQMDAVFNDQPNYVHVFGEGELNRLAPDAPERKARNEVGQQMDILAHGYKSMGRPVPPLKDLQTQAIRMLHGDGRQDTPAPKRDVSDRQRSETGQFVTTARGTNRNSISVPNRDDDDRDTLLP